MKKEINLCEIYLMEARYEQAGTTRDVATVDGTTNRINKLLFKVAYFFFYQLILIAYIYLKSY